MTSISALCSPSLLYPAARQPEVGNYNPMILFWLGV
jgi:hypothetical protein